MFDQTTRLPENAAQLLAPIAVKRAQRLQGGAWKVARVVEHETDANVLRFDLCRADERHAPHDLTFTVYPDQVDMDTGLVDLWMCSLSPTNDARRARRVKPLIFSGCGTTVRDAVNSMKVDRDFHERNMIRAAEQRGEVL